MSLSVSHIDDGKAPAPSRALWEAHTTWTSAAIARTECWLWTGPYRNVSHVAANPILYYDKSRFSARVVVAADHGMCRFTDNIMVQMMCKNTRCVSPHHMRLIQRMPRFRAATGTKRTHASMTQTEDCDESISVTPQLTADASPVPKRARVDPKLDGEVLSEMDDAVPLPYIPVDVSALPLHGHDDDDDD